MSDTIQYLILAEDLFDGLMDGTKCSTIRKGKRDVSLGPLVFLNNKEPGGGGYVVEVTDVEYKVHQDITDEDAQKDGFESTRDLFDKLREFYPDIDEKSIVTIIHFET